MRLIAYLPFALRLKSFPLPGFLYLAFAQVHDKEIIGLTVHPHLNLVATFAMDGEVRIWKP